MVVNGHKDKDHPNPRDELDEEQKSALDTFLRLCEDNDLLCRPDGMGERDVLDAINDETTLMYVDS